MSQRRTTIWRQVGLALTAAVVLAAVFCLYWRPELAFDLATRIWSCI